MKGEEYKNKMKQKVEELKSIREIIATKKEELTKRQIEFDSVNAELIMEIASQQESEFEAEEKVREEALIQFNLTGEKKMFGGIGIRVSTPLSYKEQDAINWAKINIPVAIKETLNKKQFETFAKNEELDFVIKEQKRLVTFPKEIKL